ncbi:MAG: hypothetical protein JSV98_04265 [candidate division WOR-3 bacterium]|nr:MAG: hypothetical protein JSV98_04265 [candidate division WOR-3 bacterium]
MKQIFGTLVLAGLIFSVYGQEPIFKTPIYVFDGAAPMDVGFYGAPFAYDWNGDNKKDLIVGQLDMGMVRYFENVGEDNDPVFFGSTFLQANGATIQLPSG